MYAKTGYISVFLLCVILIGVDIILRLLMIEKKTASRYRKDVTIPPSEDHSVPAENTPLLQGNSSQADLESYKLPPPSSWLTRKMPIILTFRSGALLTAFYIGIVQAFLIGSYDSTIPLVALEYYNFNSLQSGLLFLALGIPGMFSGPFAGWLVDKYGPQIVAIIGYGYLVPTHILLRIIRPGGAHEVAIFAVILAFASIGNSIIDSPSLVKSGLVIEKYHKANPTLFGETGPYAQLYGINSMMFSLGISIGPLVAGALKDSVGYGNMNAVMAAICLSAAVLSWLYMGNDPKPKVDK
jgi:MFS family permease